MTAKRTTATPLKVEPYGQRLLRRLIIGGLILFVVLSSLLLFVR